MSNKAVLMSIRPEWCNLIIQGQKIIEVRKTRPKLETPFKMMDINILTLDGWYKPADALLQAACLTEEAAKKYLQGRNGYGWHISGLKIYDKPVRLENFWAIQPCTHRGDCCTCRRWDAEKLICRGEAFGIERPPQSWCYVEDGR